MSGARLALAGLLLVGACAGGQQAVRTDRVRIFDIPGRPETEWGFDPRTTRVALGTTVTFTNGGGVFHTVTSDDPTRAFDKGLDPKEQAAITFTKAGTWSYHCGVHPDMKGVVLVCDGACK